MSAFINLNLDPNINKALIACGYETPTPIQAKAIPDILLGKDLVASAQTGTGKTAAFVLPALHKLSQSTSKNTRILILTPTRELANQITKAAETYGKFLRFNIVSLVGGMSYRQQIKELNKGADIIVATPGRLLDHMEQRRVDLSAVEMLVLDEADRMLDMGFIEDVEYIAKLIPTRQTLLFSATVDNKLATIVKHLLKNPVRINLSNDKLTVPKIKQIMYRVSNMHQKLRLLKQLLTEENIFKAIIFSATKINADNISDDLIDAGFSAAALHGDLKQNVRNRTLEQFRSGKIQFLIATDVAARGIDVSDISHVINYDLPRFNEDYVHRIGRTGRAGKEGIAISFVSGADTKHLINIERYIGQRIPLEKHALSLEDTGSTRSDFREERQSERKRAPKKSFSRERSSGSQERSYSRKESTSGTPKRFARSIDKSDSSASRGERFSKSDAPAARSERAPRSDRYERSERPAKDSRFGARSERKSYHADSSSSRSSERPSRSRSIGSESRFERSDKPERGNSRFEKNDGAYKTERRSIRKDDRSDRSDRGERSSGRSEAPRGYAGRSSSRAAPKSYAEGNDRSASSERRRPFTKSRAGSGSSDRSRSEGGKRFTSHNDRTVTLEKVSGGTDAVKIFKKRSVKKRTIK